MRCRGIPNDASNSIRIQIAITSNPTIVSFIHVTDSLMRVVTAIDLRIYCFISQALQMLVGRNVTIRINARCLDTPIPDVPINVIREIRRSEDNAEAENACEEQNDKQG